MLFKAVKSFFKGSNEEKIGLSAFCFSPEELEIEEISTKKSNNKINNKAVITETPDNIQPIYKKGPTIKDKLGVAKNYIAELNLTDAYIKLSSILLELTPELMVKNDSIHFYYSFSNRVEYQINSIINTKVNPFSQTKWVTAQGVPYTDIYAPYIKILIETGKLDEAKKAIHEALRWNPVSFKILMLYQEYCRRKGQYKNQENTLLRALELATTKEDLAECYLRLACLKKFQNERKLASALYSHGTRFSENATRVKIANEYGIELMNSDEATELVRANGIKIEAGKIVQSAYYNLMFQAKLRNDKTNFDEYLKAIKPMLITRDKLQKISRVTMD